MPGTNDFKGFALAATDTYTPAEWAALTALLANGFSTGVASTKQVNTVLRQVTSMTAALGKIISDAELNAVDDGNVTTLAARIIGALQTQFAGQSALNTRSGHTYGAADWAWLDKGRGLIVQYGTCNSSGTFSFPIAFPNACFGVVISVASTTPDPTDYAMYARNITPSTFDAYYRGIAVTGGRYIAIGR